MQRLIKNVFLEEDRSFGVFYSVVFLFQRDSCPLVQKSSFGISQNRHPLAGCLVYFFGDLQNMWLLIFIGSVKIALQENKNTLNPTLVCFVNHYCSFCIADALGLWNGLETSFCSQFLNVKEFMQMFILNAEHY